MFDSSHQPSPLLFFETVGAYQRSAALKAAIDLDVFTAIAEGANTVPELAAKCQAAERGIRILCDYLTILGFLTKAENRYGLTPDSALFLDRRAPTYMGGAVEFLLAPEIHDVFQDLATVVRTGTTTLPQQGTVTPDHPLWVKFARAMAPLMMLPAQMMPKLVPCDAGRKLKLLDIAAGHGMFGIAFAQQYPNLEVVALDWPAVLEVAQENARRFGVADRHRLKPGDAFDVDFGAGYDIILITNFLHHFDPPTCEKLLSKVRAALAENGCAVLLEFVPNPDRVTPPATAAFSMTMLASTPRGDAYTFAQLEAMLRNAGFTHSELHPLPPSPQQMVISRR
jgi:ubiquinone/menaquinone biosynthesis C-methylase UbiE